MEFHEAKNCLPTSRSNSFSWTLNPIDGTRASSQVFPSGTLIALPQDGEPVAGR